MPINKDEYLLRQSGVKSISGILDTIRLDLSLDTNPYFQAGTVTGNVKDSSGKPISDSVVIILDGNYGTLSNTVTDTSGQFIFPLLEPGSNYHAYAKAPGFSLSEVFQFNLQPNQTVSFDFTLIPDFTQNWSIITGEVKNINGLPIGSSLIELYIVNETGANFISLSFSNEIGQFVFRDIKIGAYFLKVNAPGYFPGFFPINITQNGVISRVDVLLKEDLKASKGIVVGLITDTDDQPVEGADVILYRTGTDQSHTPVAYTRTNHEGIYLFVNVPQGEYCVNSNRLVTVT